jgi:hypothetical protein
MRSSKKQKPSANADSNTALNVHPIFATKVDGAPNLSYTKDQPLAAADLAKNADHCHSNDSSTGNCLENKIATTPKPTLPIAQPPVIDGHEAMTDEDHSQSPSQPTVNTGALTSGSQVQ